MEFIQYMAGLLWDVVYLLIHLFWLCCCIIVLSAPILRHFDLRGPRRPVYYDGSNHEYKLSDIKTICLKTKEFLCSISASTYSGTILVIILLATYFTTKPELIILSLVYFFLHPIICDFFEKKKRSSKRSRFIK